ncbi:338_t:CDS:1, partial [Acaulospora colombiana]
KGSQWHNSIHHDFHPTTNKISILERPEDLTKLTNICINDMTSQPNDYQTFISNLLYRISRIPHLRAFAYTRQYGEIGFLSQLQTCLSSISFLRIEARIVRGSLQLDRLEVLYLGVIEYDVGEWSFPSLRHCAIGRGTQFFAFFGSTDRKCPISPSSLYGLRSLLFYDPWSLRIDKNFWIAYPHLECLGGYWGVDIVDPPPPGHP